MALQDIQKAPVKKRAVGRPRRLNLEAIVDAACEVGLERLEMGLVADRLNTGVGTLYGYVRDREHLLELIVQRLAGRAMVTDRGQSWQDLLREHAQVAFALFESLPHLISNLIDTTPEKQEGRYALAFLAMLSKRGLCRSIAAELYIEINQAVIGAAVSLARRKRIPAVDEHGEPIILPAVWGDYRPTLERIIAGQEAAMRHRE